MDVLSDEELRHMTISLIGAPSQRTLQKEIGASDLANQCDRCLSMAMAQIVRPKNPRAENVWLQAEIGTGIHRVLEDRVEDNVVLPNLGINGARAEQKVQIAEIPGYGWVSGTIDLSLPHQIVDWKTTDRIKAAILHDFLLGYGLLPAGTKPLWEKQKDTARYEGGYKFKVKTGVVASMSNREFHEKMDSMVHKMNGYHIQQSLYMYAARRMGKNVVKGSIIWIARDGNGFHDAPTAKTYNDPNVIHDIVPLSFDYDEATAVRALKRGESIWQRIQAGLAPEDFDADENCYYCSFEKESVAATAPDVEATLLEAA